MTEERREKTFSTVISNTKANYELIEDASKSPTKGESTLWADTLDEEGHRFVAVIRPYSQEGLDREYVRPLQCGKYCVGQWIDDEMLDRLWENIFDVRTYAVVNGVWDMDGSFRPATNADFKACFTDMTNAEIALMRHVYGYRIRDL